MDSPLRSSRRHADNACRDTGHVTASSDARRSAARTANKPRSKPLTLRFYGDEFIFDTVSGMFYRVSPTASFILRSLDDGVDPDKLAEDVQQRYGVPRAAAVRDIELLRNDLSAIEALGQVQR
jgi:hypothetical protein